MKNHFLSRFDAYYLWKTLTYFVVALSLIIISLILGIEKDMGLGIFLFPLGIAYFFYALLRPWGNAKYYGIMCIILIVITLLGFGIGMLTKWKLNLGKDFGEYIELIVPIGVIVGIIGIFRFREYD